MMCSIFSVLRYCTNNIWYNRAVTYLVDNFLADRIAYGPFKVSEDRDSPLKGTRASRGDQPNTKFPSSSHPEI